MQTFQLYINGAWVDGAETLAVYNPHNQQVIANITQADESMVDQALKAAAAAKNTMASLSAKQRGAILDRLCFLIERDKEEIARTIALEAGKGITFARGEVDRSIETFQFCADEARRICGELIPCDAAATGTGRFGYFKRYPVGAVGAITPFNFPLNLVAHKVGPAIAAGCSLVLKPASTTPLTSVKLVELLLGAGLPTTGIQLLVGSGRTVGTSMVTSELLDMITFTGSPPVGLEIRSKAGIKRTTLELGSNSALVIHEDGDIAKALPRCVVGGFSNSGQVCISIQRIYVHKSRYDEFKDAFAQSVQKAGTGDPMDDNTIVGPMIEEGEAIRVKKWIDEAVAQGASILCGGERQGTFLQPTILENTNEDMAIVSEEAFAPVVCLMSYDSIEEAIERVNNSQFGLQAGIYTADINTAFYAIDHMYVGGVIVNDMPTYRIDNMPYGGVKLSGTGREGARFSVEEMTELRTVVFNLT
ncbi:aldehyde dehydrogenase family protein [Desulfurispira natronophila]|uniref:Acyl-CoA reductase-like NAD-dependent aldehyde dehydrogenase n=1 Tax=Desulfurispira natronophila TaxID=682562 RepID=A0A7W7Y2A3_9BACT|nr:aldehyde dehydrogenase family protein [Desulfurispira natronophila]MBB5020753.1 acyl-CoA reductase-like NAD-dependent aldehyde dehydrogenase [Desulfurispira natronophila]